VSSLLLACFSSSDKQDIDSTLLAEARLLIERAVKASEKSEAPTLVHMCGIPGAGKTTYATGWLKNHPSFVLVQFDSIMEQLAGSQHARALIGPVEAFKAWELHARSIGYHLFQALIEAERDVFFDHSALTPVHFDLLTEVKRRNYSVEMHYIDCAPVEALVRVKKREREIQRHTPEYLIFERYRLLQGLLPKYKTLVDKFDCVSGTIDGAAESMDFGVLDFSVADVAEVSIFARR
jgi:predicted ABC-type ATPase